MSAFFDRLRQAARARGSLLCVGLDPDPERIPGGAAGALRLCAEVIRQTSEHACCYKPNAAFWEQYGSDGWKALIELRDHLPVDVPLLLDAKRGDVGSTMAAYARAVFDVVGADAVTASPYLGADALTELTRYAGRGVYIICRTSNPGAADLQHLVAGGRPLYLHVAALAERLNEAGNVGLVVGATAPAEVAEVRIASRLPFLLPGIGAQGGDLERAVRAAWNGDEASCLVSASRSILYASDPGREASRLRQAIDAVRAAV
ncbi:MAG TPA: orotidine-5'-phosphate decarboxylase [Candidatus Dormibacteraeota bacterium]